jgi:hypothetical protein
MVLHASWKIVLAMVTGNVVISGVDALTFVVLGEVEKQVPYGEVVGTGECLMLYPRCRTNQGRYN